MTYVIETLTIHSNIEMPTAYDVFRVDDGVILTDSVLVIDSVAVAPDLSNAKLKAKHELVNVWEAKDFWIFETNDCLSYMTISRDYSHAFLYSPDGNTSSFQPLLQALVECCFVFSGTGILHASCVSMDGYAVLFSAPSGTGKSVRARNWVNTLGASWISGDRPAVRPDLGIAHGVPWDGKDQIFVNVSAPICAIAEIRRSDRTYAREMTFKQKRAFLSAQLLIPMWDPLLVQKAFVTMKQMIERIPIYRLYCDTTEESVKQAYDVLFHHREMILGAKENTVMKMKKDFTIIDVGGDYMAVPIGENAVSFGGTVVLNEVSAFILKAMNKPATKEELLEKMLNEYDVDRDTAATDLEEVLASLKEIGLVE